MTVALSSRRAGPFEGNDATTSFPFTFKVFAESDLALTLTDDEGVDHALTLDTDYTVTLNADQDANPGGSITYPVSGDPLAEGETLVAISELPAVQETDITGAGRFLPQTFENAFDYLTILAQQALEVQSRTLRAPVSGGAVAELPSVADRASKFLAFDETGAPFATLEVDGAARSGVVVTATAAQTVFTNWGFSFAPGTMGMDVYVNGLLKYPGTDYAETNETTITFAAGLNDGDKVFFVGSTPISMGVYAASVVFLNTGDAVERSAQSKLSEIISVADYGAVGGGGSAVAAFEAAIEAAIARNGTDNVEVFVPQGAGAYTIGSGIDTQGAHVRYICASGVSFSSFANLNGTVVRPYRTSRDAFGTGDNAAGWSVLVHAEDAEAQIMGISADSELATYFDRDSAAFYAQNTAPAKFFETTATTYTATTLTSGTAVDVTKLKVGMLIDTLHATKYSGRIVSWNAGGTVITVSGWYEQGDTSAGQVPPNGTHAVINPITKVWAHNANVEVQATSYGSAACGFELGVVNNKADWAPAAREIWGYDCNNLGTYRAEAAFVQRGDFYYGFTARGAYKAAFHTGGTGLVADYGLWMELEHVQPIMYSPSGVQRFCVDQDGNLELGGISTVQNPFVDFHSSGNSNDYDVRLIATGGSVAAGLGTLKIESGFLEFAGLSTTGSAPSAGAAGALPATPQGYMSVTINGSVRKIPYYPN